MKIAVDISPVSKTSTSAHKVRGVGSYIKMLVENLPKYNKKNDYVFIENKKFPLDVDLIHYPYFDPFFITLPFHSKKKFIVTVHDLTPLVFPEHFPVGVRGRAKWLMQKHLLQNASKVIVDSDCSGRDVRDIGAIKEDKIRTVYLAADQAFKKLEIGNWKLEIRQKFNLPDKFLLYVGDATWNKNLPRLIEAVKKTEYKIVFVGKVWGGLLSDISNNPWNDDLRLVLKKIDGDEQFIKLGFVPDEELVKIYNIASALIMPSIYEGFGLPVLEAANCGCPVICSKGGSLPEVAGEAVYYIDEASSESITEGIRKVMKDLSLRKKLSEKGLTQANKFTVEKSIKDLVKVYEEK